MFDQLSAEILASLINASQEQQEQQEQEQQQQSKM
jgi:hypothetical protein